MSRENSPWLGPVVGVILILYFILLLYQGVTT